MQYKCAYLFFPLFTNKHYFFVHFFLKLLVSHQLFNVQSRYITIKY